MNENIDLTKILKDCPVGWELYSSVIGEVSFKEINNDEDYPIIVDCEDWGIERFTADGKLYKKHNGECTLFPSKDQRDWSKFTAPWYKPEESTTSPSKEQRYWSKVITLWNNHYEKKYGKNEKKEKFDPKTLLPFNRALVRDGVGYKWNADFYSYKLVGRGHSCIDDVYIYCIPYNDDTKHLLGTDSEAPDFYRYWED